MKLVLQLAIPALAILPTALQPANAAQAPQHPKLFADLDFETAKQQAKESNRWLLLDAMTSWCGPCKQMDATTWIDPRVETWVAKHAIAVQLDMDLHPPIKDSLAVRAFPTMVLFRPDGTEFDRQVGLLHADGMLAWLEGALTGDREIDRVRSEWKAKQDTGTITQSDRMRFASQMTHLGATPEASDQVLWLWTHEADSPEEQKSLAAWRRGSGRNLTADLVGELPPVAFALRTERDRRSAALRETEDAGARKDWLHLNVALKETARSVTWASTLAANPEHRSYLRQFENELFDLLVDHGLWASAGYCLGDALQPIRYLGDNLGAYDLTPGTVSASSPGKGDSIPAIPMGGMRPAESKSDDSKAPKSIPAIPMGGLRPSQPKSSEEGEAPQTLPAIPMQGPKPHTAPTGSTPDAATEGVKPKSIPAIPMGGMRPAQPIAGGSEKQSSVPSIPMQPQAGNTATTRPTTPEEVAAEVRLRLTHQLRHRAARRYGALLAAKRTAEAEAMASTLLHYADDDPARAALLGCALRAGQIEARRKVHAEWLDRIALGAGQ